MASRTFVCESRTSGVAEELDRMYSRENVPKIRHNTPQNQEQTHAIFFFFRRHFGKIYAPNRKSFGATFD